MEKRIIEINGVKMEVDMRTAKTVESYKVGDNIKLLKKDYSGYTAYPGVIIGFDEFPSHPTMVIAYLDGSSSAAGIKFCYLNSETKDIEIAPMHEHEVLFEKQNVLQVFEREESRKKLELTEIQMRRTYFLEHFNKHFEKKDLAETN